MADATPAAAESRTGAAAGGSRRLPAATAIRARYDGRGWPLFWICLKNIVFSILTFGIYRFWGKTRVRRYVWSHLLLLEEPFEYTGTGKELFFGFLKAMLVLIPLFLGLSVVELVLAQIFAPLAVLGNVLRTIVIMGLIYLGTYAARRYRMSRTLWRGIRFRQTGSPWRYLWLAMSGLLLSGLTFGLYVPFMNLRLKRFEMNNLSFGSQPFVFEGRGRDLFGPFLAAWLLAIPTLFLSFFWFAARSYRYYADRLRLAGMRFAMPVTGWRVAGLHIGNFLLMLVSLGLLYPLVVRRMMNFWCDTLRFEGSLDFAAIAQSERGPETGEGLVGFFGLETMGV